MLLDGCSKVWQVFSWVFCDALVTLEGNGVQVFLNFCVDVKRKLLITY